LILEERRLPTVLGHIAACLFRVACDPSTIHAAGKAGDSAQLWKLSAYSESYSLPKAQVSAARVQLRASQLVSFQAIDQY
jgi:hypothetical protein